MNQNLLEFSERIKKAPKPWCSHFTKEALKQNILKNISANENVPLSLQKTRQKTNAIGNFTKISADRKATIKIQLLDRLDQQNSKGSLNILGFFRPIRSLVTSMVLMTFIVGYLFTFNNVIFESNIASASIITSIEGNVYVLRDGTQMPAYANMMIREKDIILTDSNSSASIKYHDDSISRLGEKSKVKVNKLFSHPKKKTFTVIEVEVVEGDVWNRVVNLIDDGSQFRVKAKDVSTQVSEKAAFNVKAKADKVEVKVVQNSVNLSQENNTVRKTTVPQGFEAQIPKVNNPNQEIIVAENADNKNESEEKWIADNLQKDQNYMKEIVEEKRENRKKNIGALPQSPLYGIKEIKSNAKLLLAADEFEKKKLELAIANRRLQEAQVLLEDGHQDTAEEILNEFQNTAKDFSEFIETVEKDSPDKALDLRINLNETIDSNMKELAPIEPTDPLFKAKEKLIATEVIIEQESQTPEKENSQNTTKETIEPVIDNVNTSPTATPIENSLNFDKVPIVSQFNKAESLHQAAEEQKNQGTITNNQLEISTSQEPQIVDPSGISIKEF